MANFTDQKPRIVTEQDLKSFWRGDPKRESFRCYLCGYKFQLGDTWRWVYAGGHGVINFLTCKDCDCPDVLDKWINHCKRGDELYWWK